MVYCIITTLWFDVGIKRYTTSCVSDKLVTMGLWFDAGIKRYTTYKQYLAQKCVNVVV